jgi:capsular polysaccharide biosynthesis protein
MEAEAANRALVEEIVAAEAPEERLLSHMLRLAGDKRDEEVCRLFESLFWRLRINNYWILFRAAEAYELRGKAEMSFLLFGFAQALQPDSSGAPAAFRALFMAFSQRARPNEMIDIFETHAGYYPQKPIAALHEIRPLFNMTRRSMEPYLGPSGNPRADAARTDCMAFAASTRVACDIEILGGLPIPALARLAVNASRPAVMVACLQDAEVLTDGDVFVVKDSAGRPHWDVSICDFPALFERHLARLDRVEQASCEEAVIIGDRFSSPPNLSHFMLDQVTRLACYAQAGLRLDEVTVIGPEPVADFQRAILESCGVRHVIGTGRPARLRVGRLWVASNCRELQHPAHVGADWAIDYLRRTLAPETAGAPRLRLYISRLDATSRRVTNEAELCHVLAAHGFTILLASQMSYAEQAAAFAAASHVIGAHGAGLTNIVLCRPGTHVLEFFHPLYGTDAYAALAPEGGFRYAALTGKDGASDDPAFNDPRLQDPRRNLYGLRDITIDVGLVEAWLERSFAVDAGGGAGAMI